MGLVCLARVHMCSFAGTSADISISRALSFLDSPEVIEVAELPRGDLCLATSEGGKTHKIHFVHIA